MLHNYRYYRYLYTCPIILGNIGVKAKDCYFSVAESELESSICAKQQ